MRKTWSAWQLIDANNNLVNLYTNRGVDKIVSVFGVVYTRGPLRVWWEDEDHPDLVEDTGRYKFVFDDKNTSQLNEPNYLKEIWVSHLLK